MAEQRYDDMRRQEEETEHPHNPPNSVLHKGARRAAVWSYFAPVVVLFAVIGVVLLYWANRPEHSQTNDLERPEVGTVGSDQGGFDPVPKPNSTRDEIEFRAGDLAPITSVNSLRDFNPQTMAGRRVQLEDVKVESVSGNSLWIGDDDRRYPVVTTSGTPSVTAGAKVDVTGRLEPDERGSVQIVADQIRVK